MRKRRYHVPLAKPNQQIVRYGREDSYSSPDVLYAWGPGVDMKPTSRCIMRAFEDAIVHDGMTLRQILEDRGYDLTTLRFSIMKLPEPSQQEPDHGR
jgi:hypothetical protein